MAEQVVLNANNRDSEGKSSNRQLRRAGSVPAVIYGGEQEPIRISILEKDIACLLYTSPSPRDISGSRMPSSA